MQELDKYDRATPLNDGRINAAPREDPDHRPCFFRARPGLRIKPRHIAFECVFPVFAAVNEFIYLIGNTRTPAVLLNMTDPLRYQAILFPQSRFNPELVIDTS